MKHVQRKEPSKMGLKQKIHDEIELNSRMLRSHEPKSEKRICVLHARIEILTWVVGLLDECLKSPELLEKLAKLEHDQWSEFIQYLIGFAPIHGELVAKEFWQTYDTLSKTPYSQLTEKQKESDRKFARKVLAVLGETEK